MKLQGGEYIALERLEATYKSCNLVSNICVHATADATQPIAIIVPHEGHLRASLSDEDPHAPLATLCANAKVNSLVLRECNAAGKKSGFKGIEMLQAVVLTADEWTPESGLVTAAQKVQRKKVAERFDADIKVRLRACVRVQRLLADSPTLPSIDGLWRAEMRSVHRTQTVSHHACIFLLIFPPSLSCVYHSRANI